MARALQREDRRHPRCAWLGVYRSDECLARLATHRGSDPVLGSIVSVGGMPGRRDSGAGRPPLRVSQPTRRADPHLTLGATLLHTRGPLPEVQSAFARALEIAEK